MYKLVLPVLGLMFLTGIASAYQIDIDAPATLTVGKPLIVNGTTNFGIGTPIDVVLYRQLTTSTELKRRIAYVQSDHTFRVVFDTSGLEKGTYKVEVPASGLGDSVNMRLVQLIDRSDEISLSAGVTPQEYTGTLVISGTLKNNKNSGVQIEVSGPDGDRIYGPKYVPTDPQGIFTISVLIPVGGEYQISFTDTQGYIGVRRITVTGGPTATTQPVTETSAVQRLSSHAPSSRDAPAYFEVKSGSGIMNVYTSSNINWVIEYGEGTGSVRFVNDHGELNPEKITVTGNGKTIFFKVYPFRESDSGEVFLYVENARSIRVSPTVPAVFVATDATAPASETQAPVNPLTAFWALFSTGILLYLRH